MLNLASICLFKVKNETSELYVKSVKASGQRRSGVFFINFEQAPNKTDFQQ